MDDDTRARVADLNARHYANNPARYFHQRVATLLVYAADREAITSRIDSSTFEGMEMGWSDEEGDDEDQWRFVTTEAVILLHNAAEALIRMFFAHLDNHWSPWVAVSEQRPFWKFKTRVREWLDDGDQDHTETIRTLFFAGYDDLHAAAIPATLSVLRDACRVWLDEAAYYNAIKHGFAAWVGGMALKLEFPDQTINWADGRAIEVIDGGARKTLWVEPARDMKRVDSMSSAISNLWTVGRFRYGIDAGPVDLLVPTISYGEALASTPQGGATMTSPLLGPPASSGPRSGESSED